MRAPAIFFGHGSPMNAVEGPYKEEWRALGMGLAKPRAVLMVSAHWYVAESAVTASAQPETIHDFFGFPPALSEIQYPAPGDAGLVARVQALLAPRLVRAAEDWGLDHGTWSVLMHVFPGADVPVVQFAIDRRLTPDQHYDLGRRLASLRDEGVMIAGSGNVVHNLRMMRRDGGGYDWAQRFHDHVKDRIVVHDDEALIAPSGEDARLSIPTFEHYLPLLYVLGARHGAEEPHFSTDAVTLGAISMLGVRFG